MTNDNNTSNTSIMNRPALVAFDPAARKVTYRGEDYKVCYLNGRAYFQATVDLEDVELDEEAQPRSPDPDAVEKIADSIRQKIMMQPILLRTTPRRRKFQTIEGGHRDAAMRHLGHTEIPALIYLGLDTTTALRCGEEANAEDRARSLTGGETARKVHATMIAKRIELAEKLRRDPDTITEVELFRELGLEKKSQERKYKMGVLVVEVLAKSKISPYVGDRSTHDKPLTVKNLMYFFNRVASLKPIGTKTLDLSADQVDNIVRLLDAFTENVLEGKWDPGAEDESIEHKHARNLCRRHPFEALGHFVGKILDRNGGQDASLGAAWAPHDAIRWEAVEVELLDLLNSHVWDEPATYMCRSIEDLTIRIGAVIDV